MITDPLETLVLPPRFQKRRVCDVAEVNSEVLSGDTVPGYTFRYIDISSVEAFGTLGDLAVTTFKDAPSRARRIVRENDIIVSTVRTYLRAIARITDADNVIASTGFAVIRPTDEIDPDFLYWWISAHPFVEQVVSQSVGVSYPAISAEKLAKMLVPVPSREEQERVARFLEDECAQVDRLLAEMEHFRSLLIEHQQCLILEFVHGSEGGDHPLRPLKQVARVETSNVDKKTVEGETVVRLCNYVDVYKNDIITDELEMMVASATAEQISRLGLKGGDVIFTKDSETPDDIAVPAYVPHDLPGVVCGYHLAIARTFPEVMTGQFLYWCLKSKRVMDQFSYSASGVTRYGLSQAAISSVLVPVPDVSEQHSIVERLESMNARVNELLAQLEQSATLLNERKAAIITAAVTGQMEVA